MQKNSSCIETEQSYICRIIRFNHQNLLLISPPKDYRLQLIVLIENIQMNIKK